jgi:IMP cyclohydrolase
MVVPKNTHKTIINPCIKPCIRTVDKHAHMLLHDTHAYTQAQRRNKPYCVVNKHNAL